MAWPVLHLRVYGPHSSLTEVGLGLEKRGTARSVALAPAVRPGHALLTAEVQAGAADGVLEFLTDEGVAEEDIALARLDDIGPMRLGGTGASLIWADMLGQARQNARPVARYLTFMVVAGVIAGFGVIEVSAILIVGAMAVSPDVLPIAAACVAIVGGRWRLACRALITLIVGLGASCLAAALLTAGLELFDAIPGTFQVGDQALSGLTEVNSSTVGVALAAGVAGVLAIETRASAAVGVGISITTIPAAAYLGVAAGNGQVDKVWGAAAVLGVNILMLLIAGSATLLIQRRLARRPSGEALDPLD
jgi:uncharacterized hydrophobic protein (TIGR00271 family)